MNQISKEASKNREEKIFEFESVDLAKTFPEWKSPLLSVDYMFIQTYQELITAQRKLKEKEKEIEFHNAEMTNKWVELKKKQDDSIIDVETYNKFYIANENKCQRIQKKIEAEIEFQKTCKREIIHAKKRIECLEKLESDMKRSVYSLQPYHNHLEDITKQMKRFPEVSDLINYYELLNSETKLQETCIENLLGSELLHTQLLKNLKDKMTSLTEQRSKSFEYKKDYQIKEKNLIEYGEKLKQKKTQSDIDLSENIFMKQSCDNIFHILCKWKNKRFFEISEAEKLIFIGETIKELKNAVQLAYKMNYKDNVSCKTDSSFITKKRII